jgi:hypothetical protein
MGEEAATPGQPARAFARFRNVPRQFTLENCRLPLALPQIIRQAQEVSRSLHPLCDGLLRLATGKIHKLVQNLWTTLLPCGRRWKTQKASVSRLVDHLGIQ